MMDMDYRYGIRRKQSWQAKYVGAKKLGSTGPRSEGSNHARRHDSSSYAFLEVCDVSTSFMHKLCRFHAYSCKNEEAPCDAISEQHVGMVW